MLASITQPTQDESPPAFRVVRRGIFAFVAFAAGMTCARYVPGAPATLWLGIAAGLCACAVPARGFLCKALLVVALGLAGAGWFALRVHEVDRETVILLTRADPENPTPILARGLVLDDPAIDPGAPDELNPGRGRGPSSRLRIGIEEVVTPAGTLAASGVVRVFVRDALNAVRAGDRVQVRGDFEPVRGPINPGQDDDRLWAAQDGVVGTLLVASREMVSVQSGARDWYATWRATLGTLRRTASQALGGAIEDPDAWHHRDPVQASRSMLAALLLGTEDRALVPVTSAFTRLGLVHILSISGFHLVVMAGLVLFLIRLMGDRGGLEPLAVAAIILVYLLVVPAEAPVLRSGIMVLVFLLAESCGRRYDRLNLLAWIAIALLVWRPMDLFAAGFQLSFGVTAALLGMGSKVHERWFGPAVKGAIRRPAVTIPAIALAGAKRAFTLGLSTSVMAWVISTPLIIFHSGLLSTVAPITGLVLTPIFVLIMWAGYLTLAVGLVWPALAEVCGSGLLWLGDVAVHSAKGLDGLPFMAVGLPRVSVLWVVTATGVGVYWLLRGTARDTRAYLVTAGVVLWLALTCGFAARAPTGSVFTAHAIASGQSHALVFRAANQAVLVLPDRTNPAQLRRAVPAAVRELGGWRVRTVILTDATVRGGAGALPDLLAALAVTDVFVPPALEGIARERPKSEQAALLAALRGRDVTVRTLNPGDVLRMSSRVKIEFGDRPAEFRVSCETIGADPIWLEGADLGFPARSAGSVAVTPTGNVVRSSPFR